MSSTFDIFVERTPAIVENKKFGLKVRLEAQRCITYGKLALSAQRALCKEQDPTSPADQPVFAGDSAKLVPLRENCERILSSLMQDAYKRHLGTSDVALVMRDASRIPEDQQGELLNAFKAAKEQLQSYVAELDDLLAKQQPQQPPAVTKPQPTEQSAPPALSSNELERIIVEKFSRSGIRISRASEAAATAALSKGTSGAGRITQASTAPAHAAAEGKAGSASSSSSSSAAAAAGTTSRWSLPSLSPKELNAAVQLTLKVAEMQAAIAPRPADMPLAFGRGFGAMAVKPNAAAAARGASQRVMPAVSRPTPSRPVLGPRLSAATSSSRSVDRAAPLASASIDQVSAAVSVTPSIPAALLRAVPSAPHGLLKESQTSVLSQVHQGPIRLLAKPLECPVQRICSVSLSPFAVQVRPQATRPAAEVLKQLQEMRNPEDAWRCRATWMLEVAKALEILHRHKVVHGCITADNVMLSSHQTLGSASYDSMDAADETLWSDLTQLHAQLSLLQAFKDASSPRLSRLIEFSPPELLLRGEALSEKSDVYTFGLLMVQLLTGWAPGNYKSDRDLSKAVHEGHIFLKQTKRPVDPAETARATNIAKARNPKLAHLLEMCLVPIPDQRPTARQIVKILSEESVGDSTPSGRS